MEPSFHGKIGTGDSDHKNNITDGREGILF